MSETEKQLKEILLAFCKQVRTADAAEGYDFIMAHFEEAMEFVKNEANAAALSDRLQEDTEAAAQRTAVADDYYVRAQWRTTFQDHFKFRARMHDRNTPPVANVDAGVAARREVQIAETRAAIAAMEANDDPETRAAEAAVLARAKEADAEWEEVLAAAARVPHASLAAAAAKAEADNIAAHKRAKIVKKLAAMDRVYVRNTLPGILPLAFLEEDGTLKQFTIPQTKLPVRLSDKTTAAAILGCADLHAAILGQHLTLLDPDEAEAELGTLRG